MGVGWNLQDAIIGSLKETFQGISHKVPSHQVDINPFALEQLEKMDIPNIDMYYDRLFEDLSPKQLHQEYSYLSKSNLYVRDSNIKNKKPTLNEYIPLLKTVSEELSIELLICFIPSLIEDIPGSVIRIMGKGAFPHIKTDSLDPFIYSINGMNNFLLSDIPNRGRMVPFN